MSRMGKSTETESRLVVSFAGEGRVSNGLGMTANRCRVSLVDDEKFLNLTVVKHVQL